MESLLKKTLAAILVMSLLLSYTPLETLADASDCLDGCFTACVRSDGNTRLLKRCEGKCQIRCRQASEVDEVIKV